MATAANRLTRFRTPADQRRFDELYARLRAERWPASPVEADLDAPLGTAHTFSWPGTGTPVLLLPGWNATAWSWAALLDHGLGGRPVHTVDLVGHVGLSVQRDPITELTDYLPWLDAVADGLALDRVHVVGASYGGALTLLWSAHAPGRVATATLLDPAGLVDVDMRRFIVWGMQVFGAALLPMRFRRPFAERLHTRLLLDADTMRLGQLAFRRTRYEAPDAAHGLDDDALRSVRAPTLALLAEHSAVMDPAVAAERARALLPDVTVEIVEGAGHTMPVDDAPQVAARVRAFLDAHDTVDGQRSTT